MKHAYLILAHNQFALLKKLILALDNENNDIFIHIDKKNKDINQEELKHICKYSNIQVIKKYKVNWGSMSIINAELALLKLSIPNKYDFYHFISGQDFPIKSQQQIQAFYEAHKDKNFIMFCTNEMNNRQKTRYMYHYFFVKRLNNCFQKFFYTVFNKVGIRIQKLFKVNRDKKLTSYYGSQWCDITHEFATYILANEKLLHKRFNNTYIPDESVFPSFLIYGGFYDTLYNKDLTNDANMREIDWERGSPYTYTENDFNLLTSSNHLFARKFDYIKSPKIIDMLVEYINK